MNIDTLERRNFLVSAGIGLAGFGAAAMIGAAPVGAATSNKRKLPGAGDGDIAVLQGALALENEGIAAYSIAGGSGLLSAEVLKVALVFLGHHKAHRDSLASLIIKAGGKAADPKSDAEYTRDLDLGSLKSQGDVIALAARLEQGAANAYVGQVAALKDRSLATLFAQLSTDEAVHWAILNNALGNSVPSTPYLFG